MPANELLIKINGDAKSAQKAFDDTIKKTEELQSTVDKASIAAAAAFAALTAEVFLSVRAFGEQEKSVNQLSNALQNQGIFTAKLRDDYIAVAQAISDKTGIDDDQIIRAQAIAQSYIGQQKVTKELTQVIVDLGAKLGSVEEAAGLVGKAIGGNTNTLARQRVEFREGASTAEKYREVIKQLSVQVGGFAETADKGVGSLKNVGKEFEDVQKKIGERFAPVVVAIGEALAKLFNTIQKSPLLLDLTAALIAGAAAATGLIAVAAPLVAGFTAISAALAAVGVAGAALTFTLAAVPALIAGVVAGAVYLALNWEQAMLRIRAAASAAGEFLAVFFQKIGEAVNAAADLRFGDAIAAALGATVEASKAAYEKYNAEVNKGEKKIQETKKESLEVQNKEQKDAADKLAAEKRRQDAALEAARKAGDELKLLQLRKASKEEIDIKQQEIAIIKDLEKEKNVAVIAAANKRLEELRALEAAQHADELVRTREFAAERQAVELELIQQGQLLRLPLIQAALDAQKEQHNTELATESQIAQDKLKIRIAADNQYLLDRKKFGATYAAVNKVLGSEEVSAAKDLSGELVGLAQSRNSTLKTIGKVAAISQIAISTAESAAKVFADAVILLGPFAGPPVGAALAAARIAYGAEQIGNVTAAASGALVGGAGTRDTQPFLLTPGELVAPRRSFNEVVSGVQTERSGIIDEIRDKLTSLGDNQGGAPIITIQGDFYGDETFIDKLGAKLSDAIQYRNLRFVQGNA